ncbi:MAG: DUF924 domain-containing protein [Gammaproteobacteria bacterium]|nr:DUF924 domain-containing protein [Gammaproteobacteria bacterium]
METSTLEELHLLWFGTMASGWADSPQRISWFAADPGFDAELIRRFAGLPERLLQEPRRKEPAVRELLSTVLAFDQLPRHLYRGTSRAFAFDAAARDLAAHIIDSQEDMNLTIDERAFVYMPFLHSESLEDQVRSVRLFTALRNQTPKGYRYLSGAFLQSAHQHHDIIRRFGRFPHRHRMPDQASSSQSPPVR